MQVSLEPKIELRSKIARIAAAVGLALVIGSFGVGSASAADNHGGNYHGGDQHHDNGNHGGGYRGARRRLRAAGLLLRAAAGLLRAPEPYNYYGDSPQYPVAPPQGVTLFFGL